MQRRLTALLHPAPSLYPFFALTWAGTGACWGQAWDQAVCAQGARTVEDKCSEEKEG